MVPKTKVQKEVWGIYEKFAHKTSLPFARWVKGTAIGGGAHMSYLVSKNSKERWCPKCGETYTPPKDAKPGETVKCPHCGKRLFIPEERYKYHWDGTKTRIKEEKTTSFRTAVYVEKFETHKGWQVDRVYVADFLCTKGKKARLEDLVEIFSHWFNPETGKALRMGRLLAMYPNMRRIPFSLWNDGETPEIRRWTRASYGCDWYSGWHTVVYPRKSVLDCYKRCNYASLKGERCDWFGVFDVLNGKESAVIVETLQKTGDAQLLTEFMDNAHSRDVVRKHWRSIILAKRHGLQWRGVSPHDYVDYIEQLSRLHLDMHSPHYLVPSNFAQAHDDLTHRLMSKEEREREMRRLENERKKMQEDCSYNRAYKRRLGKFFGVVITDGKLTASPLKSVEEFFEEGSAMRHCVFSNGYYKHTDALILSVRDADNNHVETVEVNTGSWKVVQSRGYRNSVTPYHEEILEMFRKNVGLLKRAAEKKTKRAGNGRGLQLQNA